MKLAAEKTSCLEHIWRSGPLNNELIQTAREECVATPFFRHSHKVEDIFCLCLSYHKHIVPSCPGAVRAN